MAGTFLTIYPYPLTNLSVTSPSTTYNIMDNGSNYMVEFVIGKEDPVVTISANGYESQTITISRDTTVTLTQMIRDISKLSNGTNTYTIKDSTARSELANKQDTLVSGTNIKTINGNSLLGSGDIVIETSSTPNVDDETISYNSSDALQAIAVKNKRDNSTLPIWHGTEQQWNQGVATTWYYWQTAMTALWSSSTLPSSASWTSVTYGDGKFVAVASGPSNISAYSTDGINWTASTLPSSASWYSVTYGDGKFVAVAGNNSNKAAYSTDGINWTASTLPSSAKWMSVTYGDGKFVAVAQDKSAYSTDGINWTASTLPSTDGSWWSVTYGDGKFVAISYGSRNQAAYSTDGINWTASTLPSSTFWWSVTYGDGKFVAVIKSTYSNTSAYSTDGINWTASTLPSSANWYSVTYGDGKFVAVAGENSDKAAYSTDGINWTASTLPSSASWKSVTYGDGKFVAVSNGSDASAIFTMSYDKCYTLDQNPTTSSQVYSVPEITSTKTITSVGSGTITLSDNLVYNSTPSGNQNTYRTIGVTHPDWLCNINNVGVKIGNTIVATAGGSGSSYTAGDGIDITSNEISVTSDISTGAALGATAVQPSALATVATSGSYNDLSNKPTIPTVNNATLTIQKNGTNVATFTANASSNVTANISVPTNTNELTNGAGFITSSALSGYQTTTNLVTSVSSSSTDSQYPSAKLFYDTVGDVVTLINAL